MSLRLILIALATTVALGAAIYWGMQAADEPDLTALSLSKTAKTTDRPKGADTNTTRKPGRDVTRTPVRPIATPQLPSADADTSPEVPPAPTQAQAEEKEQILAALEETAALPEGSAKGTRLMELISKLAFIDPVLTLDYISANLPESEQIQQKMIAYSAWATKNPAAASSYFRQQVLASGTSDLETQMALAAGIAQGWAGQDTGAAWSWIGTLPPEIRGVAASEVISKIAADDPQAALHAVNTLEGDERAEAMHAVAEQWSRRAPVVAAAWVSGLKDEAQQTQAANGLVNGWMDTSPRAVSEWVRQLPQGSVRDSAIATMVQNPAAMKNPEAALTWAASIQNLELRNEMLPKILTQWQEQDPAGAQQFISKLPRAPK